MSNQYNSDKAPEPVGLYPHARRVGELLFLSGVGPRERGTKVIPGVTLDDDGNIIAYNIEAQCRSVFNNVKLILEASGSSWDQLVDVTVFLTNMKDDFKTYNRIYAEYFKDNQPCRTTVEINCLPTPIAIELKCIATIKSEESAREERQESEAIEVRKPVEDKPVAPPAVLSPEPKQVSVPPVVSEPKPEPTPEPEPIPAPIIEKPAPTPPPAPTPKGDDDHNKPRTPQW